MTEQPKPVAVSPAQALPATQGAPSPHEVRLAPRPDAAGGACVFTPAGTRRLVVTGTDLKAVDVVADADLREVDLSGCGPGLHMSILGASALARVALPATGPGAVLHLDVGAPIEELTITGPCDLVDVAWRTTGGTARGTYADAPKERPFDGAWLGAAPKRPVPSGLVVVTGGEAPADLLSDCGLVTTHLFVEACSAPSGLDLPSPLPHATLREVDTPRLNAPELVQLRLDDCRGLRVIDGRAHRIVLRGGDSGARLDIEAWADVVDLTGLRAETLCVAGVARLEASDTTLIGRLDRSRHRQGFELVVAGGGAPQGGTVEGGKLRPLSAADVERQFARKDGFGQAAMMRWAAGCDQQSQLWLALHVLAVAVDHGHDAAECWKARDGLLARNWRRTRALRRRGGSGVSWNWSFPEDLALRGWTGDLRLWLRALASGVEGTAEWAGTFARSTSPEQIGTLLTVAASPDVSDGERRLLMDIAAAALGRAAEPPSSPSRGRRHRVEVAGATDLGWLHQGARALIVLAAQAESGLLAGTFARWVERLAPTPEGVRLLDQLASHGCARAHRALLDLRRSLDRRGDLTAGQRQALAATLTMVLLAPSAPNSPTFPPEQAAASAAPEPSPSMPGDEAEDPASGTGGGWPLRVDARAAHAPPASPSRSPARTTVFGRLRNLVSGAES